MVRACVGEGAGSACACKEAEIKNADACLHDLKLPPAKASAAFFIGQFAREHLS
jgi:hypothetical protein